MLLPIVGVLLVAMLTVQPLVTLCGLCVFVPAFALEGYLAFERRAIADDARDCGCAHIGSRGR